MQEVLHGLRGIRGLGFPAECLRVNSGQWQKAPLSILDASYSPSLLNKFDFYNMALHRQNREMGTRGLVTEDMAKGSIVQTCSGPCCVGRPCLALRFSEKH